MQILFKIQKYQIKKNCYFHKYLGLGIQLIAKFIVTTFTKLYSLELQFHAFEENQKLKA